ncbi:hypothetical protein PIB30_095200 [Stylosanthes scabra]|uniref:Uncharacterized protein n=1 Tax=Stylosanthes scabra TaxID=79078 RepID=A0ABU6YUL6_9FABA|nr:hypothetical protein [Stylosanthes scabra]
MRDVMLKRPNGNSHHLLPYPIFILRLAAQFESEQPKVRRGRIIPQAPPVPPPEQHPPSPQAQPSTATVPFPSATIGSAPEPSPRNVMRHLHRFSARLFYGRWQ